MILFDLDKINRTRDDGFPFNIPIDSPIKTLGVIDERIDEMVLQDVFKIKRVIFNNPATIVFWEDGIKTVVKAHGDEFDEEKGLAMAIAKRALGNTGRYYDVFKKWIPEHKSEIGQKVRILCCSLHPELENHFGVITEVYQNGYLENIYKIKVKLKDGTKKIIALHDSKVRKVYGLKNVD